MKKKFKLMMLLFVVICASIQCFAQNDDLRLSRDELAITQARHIAAELQLDEATTKKFIKTYCAYQQEIWALGPRESRNLDTSENPENRLDRSQKILDIRKKYYAKFSKFLTPGQIDKVYRLEKKMMDRLSKKNKDKNKYGPKSK